MSRFIRSLSVTHVALLLALAFVVNCGDSDDPAAPPVDEPKVLDIALEASAGAPGDLVRITGLPDDITGLYGEVSVLAPSASSATRASTAAAALILREPGGDDFIALPLNPSAPMDGGDVEIQITDGDNTSSNSVTVTLEGLTPAPGAYAAFVSSLQQLLDGWLDYLGTTREALQSADVKTLPITHTSILFAHNVIDGPDNDNSLRAIADGDIPMFSDNPIDHDVLDALTAQAKLKDWVDEKIGIVDTLSAPPELPSTPATMSAGMARRAECIEAPTFNIDDDDCSLLAELMKYQTGLEVGARSAADRVVNDGIGALLAQGDKRIRRPVSVVIAFHPGAQDLEEAFVPHRAP
jgi:hypothetical protein